MIISDGLSIVIPCYNEGENLETTIRKILISHESADFPIEIIISDDGSTDNCIARTKSFIKSSLVKFLNNKHQGRIETIHIGISEAKYPNVMVLGSRVQIRKEMLNNFQNLHKQHPDAIFWNGFIHVIDNGNPLVSIWQTLVFAGWGGYLQNPSTTHFGLENFDKFPKGSGFFIAPKDQWLRGFEKIREYSISQKAAVSDDTRLIRDFAAIDDIWISPEIEADYQPRTTWKSFLRNGYYRGTTFVDSYWDSRSIFGKLVRYFLPLVLTLLCIGILRAQPRIILDFVFVSVLMIMTLYLGIAYRRKKQPLLALKEVFVLIPLLTVFTAGFLKSYFQGLRKRIAVSKLNKSK